MGNILSRLQEIAREEGITIGALERVIGASKGVLSRAINNGTDIQSKWIGVVVDNYPQYSTRWLLTGEGSMLRNSKNPEETKWSSTAIATPISPAEESVIYKMYKDKDEESRALIRENGRLEERLRSMEQELGALKSKYPHESPPGIVRESGEVLGSSETAKDAHSKRRTPASEPSYKHL